jgi:L-alanine-DL-glutamate epimerase-like enolase superfamily enzyme
MNIRIERVEVFGVEMPLVGDFPDSKGSKTSQKSAVVKITGTGGITGISSIELSPHRSPTKKADPVLKILKDRFVPALIGVDPTNINRLFAVLDAANPEPTHAKVAIEMACVDLTARSFDVPIYTYLGGAVQERLEFIAWIGMLPPDEAAAEASRWFKKGFRSAKIKIGEGIEADRDRVAAVRAAVGSKMALRIDANERYDAATSIKLAQMVRKFDLQVFEQPVPRHDLAGMALVRREGGIPVMADESVIDHASLLAVIKAEAADVVKLAVRDVGGFYSAVRLLATAEAAGIPCMVGHGFGLDLSTRADIMLAATSRNVIAGIESVGPLKVKDTVATTPLLDISSGSLSLPSGPGLGISLDDAKLEKYRLESDL